LIAGAILTLILIVVSNQGCRKDQKNSTDSDLAEKLKKTREWVATQPKFTTHIVNEKIPVYQEDEQGNIIPRGSNAGQRISSCPSDVEPEVTFESWAADNPNCSSNNTYQVYASFTISSENAIVADNPNNSSQHTRGRMIVTVTATGANVSGYPNNNITPVTITTVGTDPTDPNRTIYRVTWTNQNVASSVFSGSNSLRVGLYFFTDCADESQFPYTVVANLFNIGGITACNVVSPVFVDPSVHAINGVSACSCCNPDILPQQQEVWFTRPGFSWSHTIGITDTYFPGSAIPTGYTYTVTYRNVMTSGGSCTGPWLFPSTTVNW